MNEINKKELKKLFSDFKADNEKAFEELYKKYNKLVYKISFGILKNHHDAEDVVSIVFTKIYKMNKENLPIHNEPSWLYTITKNESINLYKSKREYISIEDFYEIQDKNDEINNLIDKIEFNNLIKHLPDDEKEIISLKIISNLTFDEIATILNTSTGTIKWKYYKVVNKLKLLLSNLGMIIITFTIGLKYLLKSKPNEIENTNKDYPSNANKNITEQNTTGQVKSEEKSINDESNLELTDTTRNETNTLTEENDSINTITEQPEVINNKTNNYIGTGFLTVSFTLFIIFLIFLIKNQLKPKNKLSK